MTAYAANIQRAIARIKAKGMLVYYTQVPDAFVANDPAQPWKIGAFTAPINVGLNNLVNAAFGNDPTQLQSAPLDPNARAEPVTCSMVMLDAKARGSSTQGMAAEFLNRTDIAAGNKLGLMAGGQGLSVKIGDIIDCNVAPNSGFPVYKVAKFKSLAPDGTPILYALELEL
jgi:hypothetical protein